jgi:MFS family permease
MTDAASEPAPDASPLAVAGVIFAMALIAVGNGLMFAFIPVRLGAEGYAPTWAGAILTSLSAGGIVGCLVTGRLVARTGHARAFMLFSALIILSNTALAAGAFPSLWMASRALYGFAISGLFIVTQSWLNDAVANVVRGRVMAAFYVAYVVGLGGGSFLLRFVDVSTPAAPLVSIAFSALSVIPVAVTLLRPPARAATASVAFRRAWRISPAGMAGMLAVGGLSMMIAGFAPIHATASGYSPGEVATLLFAMPLGTLLFQLPFGWVSDRTDRRYVLIAASLIVAVAGLVAARMDGSALPIMIAIYIVWSGASESIYSLASAHANDRAAKDDMVSLSSTMLFAWSLSGFFVPAAATALTALYGTRAFMWLAVAIAAVYCAFVIWRVLRAEPAAAEPAAFKPLPAHIPPPVEGRP